MQKRRTLFFILLTFFLFGSSLYSQTRNREEIDDKYKWDLTDLYASDEAFQKAKEATEKRFDKLAEYKGQLTKSPQKLLQALEDYYDVLKDLYKLSSYSSKKSHLDLRNSEYLGMSQGVGQMFTQLNSKTAFWDPEILTMTKEQIDAFIAQEPGLKVYEFYLHDLLLQAEHRLTDKEEKIIAESGLIRGATGDVYDVFKNAEMPYPRITLSNAEDVLVDQAGFARYRADGNREDRKKVFKAFFNTFNDFKGTFGTTMDGNIKSRMFTAHVRNYKSNLESSLSPNNIPVEVYYSLVENVNKNLKYFHRYLDIKKRMMGLDTLFYYDLYAPAVKGIDMEYEFEQGKEIVLASLKPLGKEYIQVVQQAFDNRWIDVYPTPGKRAGAYSSGSAVDVHPFMLMNYNNLFRGVSTLTHELGHTMQSYYSNKTQNFANAGYPIFVAEVASTLNEALLFDEVYKKTKDDDQKLSFLMNYLDDIKGTFFRQTQFAEFELRAHQMAEKGEPITGDSMTELYKEIVRKYYGHDNVVCVVPDYINLEWAYIPHFYRSFYVYQYATSFTASTALAEGILKKEKGALEKYMTFLSAGGSKYPIDLLKDAGVDMTGPVPFDKTMSRMNWAMDEIEKILKKKGI